MRHRRSSDLPAGFVPARLAPTPGLEGLAQIVRWDWRPSAGQPLPTEAVLRSAPMRTDISADPKRGKRGKRQK